MNCLDSGDGRCAKPGVSRRGLCLNHYMRRLKAGTLPEPPACKLCGAPLHSNNTSGICHSNPVCRAANVKARKQRADRPCRFVRSRGCMEFASIGQLTCRKHGIEDTVQRNKRRRAKLKLALATTQGWVCSWCEQPLPSDLSSVQIDHIIPRAHGGPDEDWNLQAMHWDCNLSKFDQVTEQARTLAAEHDVALAA